MENRASADIQNIIITLAKRDIYNGVGRVFISELIEQGYTRDQVTLAIENLKSNYKIIVVGDIIKVYFGEGSV
ncbi:MAG: hypothetical protein ABWK01_08700 [Infirmifilum sp.]